MLKDLVKVGMVVLPFLLTGCSNSSEEKDGPAVAINTFDQYRAQKIEPRDSMLVLYTVRGWHDTSWFVYDNLSRLHKADNSQMQLFLGGTFYSPDKLKMIVWVGERAPNATTGENYGTKPGINRMCPTGGDTVYNMNAVIGFRNEKHEMWILYPLINEQATCFDYKEQVINVLGQYYFEKMMSHSAFIINDDKTYGGNIVPTEDDGSGFILKEYGYNLQDKDFWDKSLLWQKGARIPGLYDFQTNGNVKPSERDAEMKLPSIVYPNDIRSLYKN